MKHSLKIALLRIVHMHTNQIWDLNLGVFGINIFFLPHQRRDFRILAKALPPKQEYVLNIRFSSLQDQLYSKYLKDNNMGRRPSYSRYRRRRTKGQYEASDLFSAFSNLMKVSIS